MQWFNCTEIHTVFVSLLQFDIKKVVMDLRRQRQGMIQTKVNVANFGIKENNCKYNSCSVCDFGQYL